MKYLLLVAAMVVAIGFIVAVLRRTDKLATTEAEPLPSSGEVTTLEPSQLLYSLPTICDRMAPLEAPTGAPTNGDLMLHEDDWRQIEFVPLQDAAYISSKLEELRQFKIDHRSGPGWTDTFVRPDHPTDFRTLSLRFADLSSAFFIEPGRLFVFQSWSAPIQSAGQVPGGFSFRIDDGMSVYGFQRDGTVESLGIAMDTSESHSLDVGNTVAVMNRIRELAAVNIVDWYQCTTVAPDSASEIKAWLER